MLALLEDGAYHCKRRTLLEKVKWDTLGLVGVTWSTKTSGRDTYDVALLLVCYANQNTAHFQRSLY